LFVIAIWAPGDTVMGFPKLMLAIVMVAAAAAADPLVCPAVAVGLAVAVAVSLAFSCVELLDPPHAVANAATRHMAAQNKPNLFILTLLDWTLRETRLSIRIGSHIAGFGGCVDLAMYLRSSHWSATARR
jgi:hypothetical protein